MRIELRKQIILHEGLELKPYADLGGKITIGVGRNLTDNGISAEESNILLDNDIDRSISELNLNFSWFCGLDDIRQRVLIDMCFNLGITKLKKFVLMLAAIEAKNYDLAASYMMQSIWAEQVGIRAIRLSKMMRTGKDYE